MSFYLFPPGGNISLQMLECFAVTRLQFLIQIYNANGNRVKMYDIVMDTENVKNSECLIGGTVKDKVSHFFLRLACCEDDFMQRFFVTMETALFDYRMSCMTHEELVILFKSIKSVLSKQNFTKKADISPAFSATNDILVMFLQIKGRYTWKKVLELYVKGEDKKYFTLPFQVVLPLVTARQITLNRGLACVPYCKLREVVSGLFQQLLEKNMIRGRQLGSVISEDHRIGQLILKLKTIFRHKFKKYPRKVEPLWSLSHDQVDEVTSLFPPCMVNLMGNLRYHHRLRHHSRIHLLLFLKETGLPIDEALMFWRKEYSLDAEGCRGCVHSWQDNERRYTYNIRHLYGLEGSRINYSSHCCKTLQEFVKGPFEDGGCPFSHFDKKHLEDMLVKHGINENTETILGNVDKGLYTEACSVYMELKQKVLFGEKNLLVNKHSCLRQTTDSDMACSKDQLLGMDQRWQTLRISTQTIRKPIDYFVSFRTLQAGLKNTS